MKNKLYLLAALFGVISAALLCTGLAVDTAWKKQDERAGEFTANVLGALLTEMEDTAQEVPGAETQPSAGSTGGEEAWGGNIPQAPEPDASSVDVYDLIPERVNGVTIDGITYLGVIEIPELSVTLPVILLNEWDPDMMDYAPCTYSGSLLTQDLVIMAHNYESHFRPILAMQPGQTVILTADGYIYTYTVTAVDAMHRSEKEQLYAGNWDLTLFTCVPQTYNRCAVRCKLVAVEKK